MNYCMNTTSSICSQLFDYCMSYCSKDNHDNPPSNCLCECLIDDISYDNFCVANRHDILVLFFLVPVLILISCLCCLRKKKPQYQITSSLPYSSQDIEYQEPPEYSEVININPNTSMPLTNK